MNLGCYTFRTCFPQAIMMTIPGRCPIEMSADLRANCGPCHSSKAKWTVAIVDTYNIISYLRHYYYALRNRTYSFIPMFR